MDRLKRAWRKAPWLTAWFTLALLLTLFFGVQMIRGAIFWADPRHTEQAIAGWMTPGYIARSWSVPREVVAESLDLPPRGGGRIRLDDVAEERGTDIATLAADIEAAIIAFRAAQE